MAFVSHSESLFRLKEISLKVLLNLTIIIVFVTGLCLLPIGCSEPEMLSLRQLEAYLLDGSHGTVKKKEVNEIEVEAIYKPTSLMVVQEIDDVNTTQLNALKAKYSPYLYFVLNISKEGKGILKGHSNYSELLQTLSFQMANYIEIATSKGDTIPISDYAFQNTFGVDNSNSLLLAFSKEKMKSCQNFTLVIREFGLQTGDITLEFDTRDLEKVPELDFSSVNKEI